MFYTNPTRCSQSVSMATESVIIEPRRSPLSRNKVEADEYELSLAHHQLFLFLLLPLLLSFFKVLYKKSGGIEDYQEEELYIY